VYNGKEKRGGLRAKDKRDDGAKEHKKDRRVSSVFRGAEGDQARCGREAYERGRVGDRGDKKNEERAIIGGDVRWSWYR